VITTILSLIESLMRRLRRTIHPRRPRFPLFNSGDPELFNAPDDELLKGFGER
jgi:hypothetical protein